MAAANLTTSTAMNDVANPQLLEDQRRFQRVEFFLVPTEHEQLPVWIFKPQDLAQKRAGVVLNISEGGLQIMTGAVPPLEGENFQLSLLLGEDEGVPLFQGPVKRVWRRGHTGRSELGGFEFATPNSLAEEFLATQTANVSARQWVRCVLAPLPT